MVLFARTPAGEESAKRIARSRELFECSARRICDAVASLPDVDLIVAAAEASAEAYGTRSILQRGSSFGERFRNVMQDVKLSGYESIVAIPIDVPLLSADHLQRAFTALRTVSLVLGPSPDGGVYLIGVRGDSSDGFSGISWQTDSVFRALCCSSDDVFILPILNDIDSIDDVVRLLPVLIHDREIFRLLRRILSATASFSPIPTLPFPLQLSFSPTPARAPPS